MFLIVDLLRFLYAGFSVLLVYSCLEICSFVAVLYFILLWDFKILSNEATEEPEGSGTPGEYSPQNQLTRTHGGSQRSESICRGSYLGPRYICYG